MKVTFLIDHYRDPHAGTERQLFLLATGLIRKGVNVTLAVFRHSSYTSAGGFPAPVQSLDIGRVLSLWSWWRLFRWARQERATGLNVVHVFFNDPALFAPVCLALAGVPCIVARRDMGFWYTPWRLRVLRVMQRYVAVLAANSRAVADFCGSAEGYPARKRVVIGNAIEVPAETTDRKTRSKFVVGLVANVRPIKRIDDAVRAIALLAENDRHVHLRVVGGGDPNHLRRLAEEFRIADAVEFAGPSRSVYQHLMDFDVGILCSESEGLSNAVMEYMAAGLPVVATDTGGNGELVTEGKTGFLYPVGDYKNLAQIIERLIDEPELRYRLGRAGKAKVRDRFSMNAIVDEHISLYTRLSRPGLTS